jgi:hypothetical protein
VALTGAFGSLLRNRRFRYYWLSQAAGDAGYAVYAISIVWLGYRLSGSALVVGVLLGVEFAVYAVSFLAGVIIDRVRDLRNVLLVGYPLQAAGAFALGTLLLLGVLTVPVLLVLVTLISLVWDFTWTANNAIPPTLVDHSELLRANSLVSAVTGGNQIAGYAIGGTLLLFVGPATGQFLYGALNLLAALLAVGIAVPTRARSFGGFVEGLREGFLYLFRKELVPIRHLAFFGCLTGVLSLAPPLLITLLSGSRYPLPAETYGLLFTAYAAGGVGGSLLLGQWNPRGRLALVLFGATVMEGVLVLVAVLAVPGLVPSSLTWLGVGMTDVTFWTVLLAYLQARVPRPLLARTITNAYLFRGSGRAAGVVLLGALGTLLLPTSLAVLVGGLFLLVAAAGWLVLPALRELAY